MRQGTKDALRWFVVPIGYLLACLAYGALGAWGLFNTSFSLSPNDKLALFYSPCIALGILAGALTANDLPLKVVAAIALIPLGSCAAAVSGYVVGCGYYNSCL